MSKKKYSIKKMLDCIVNENYSDASKYLKTATRDLSREKLNKGVNKLQAKMKKCQD